MKTLFYIALVLLILWGLSSCNSNVSSNKGLTKPFNVIYSSHMSGYETHYRFQDANGNTQDFYDRTDKYNCGDTLK